MDIRHLSVRDAVEVTPRLWRDARGEFFEWFRSDVLREALGRELPVAQANASISRRGVLRGLHFADVPPGQAKFVTCQLGRVLDVVVDLRSGSPTFGEHELVELDAARGNAVFIPEGLGHGFLALDDNARVTYLCSTSYNPSIEHEVNPVDPALAIAWPAGIEQLLSDKDRSAPTLAEAAARGILPSYEACRRFYAGVMDGMA